MRSTYPSSRSSGGRKASRDPGAKQQQEEGELEREGAGPGGEGRVVGGA